MNRKLAPHKDCTGCMTIGDFWGVEQTDCSIKNESNLSCVITHDTVGEEILKQLKDVICEEVRFEDIAGSNSCLSAPRNVYGWRIKNAAYIISYHRF